MSNLPIHRLIAAAGGLVLPLIAGDAPVMAAPIEPAASLAARTTAAEPERRDGLQRSVSLVSNREADK